MTNQRIESDDNNIEQNILTDINFNSFLTNEDKTLKNENLNLNETSVEPERAFFSQQKFNDLDINQQLKDSLLCQSFVQLTDIQAKVIPFLLKGKDVLAEAKTGSGKTLAFLVPAIDRLVREKFLLKRGTGILIITPTRELAIQIHGVCKALLLGTKFSQTVGIIIGGNNKKTEERELVRGCSILVSTPGRLLDHLMNTSGFIYNDLLTLVIDEADRILQIGFEEDMNKILSMIPSKRQTCLFSATQTSKVRDLARLSLREPKVINSRNQGNGVTADGITQGYVVCCHSQRLYLLLTFLKKYPEKKIMCFFSTCNSVKFHEELFNYIDLKVLGIHGQKKQTIRSRNFQQFCNARHGILLCTDVAARGLDIPKVDWIIQVDPPGSTDEYIHRVGRTARGETACGHAIIFLTIEELAFVKELKNRGVTELKEFTFPSKKLINAQKNVEKIVETNFYINKSCIEAYKNFISAYAAYPLKNCFNIGTIDIEKVAKGFGLSYVPKVDLNVDLYCGAKKRRKLENESRMRKKKGDAKKKDI